LSTSIVAIFTLSAKVSVVIVSKELVEAENSGTSDTLVTTWANTGESQSVTSTRLSLNVAGSRAGDSGKGQSVLPAEVVLWAILARIGNGGGLLLTIIAFHWHNSTGLMAIATRVTGLSGSKTGGWALHTSSAGVTAVGTSVLLPGTEVAWNLIWVLG
jgi:hypothetical protein